MLTKEQINNLSCWYSSEYKADDVYDEGHGNSWKGKYYIRNPTYTEQFAKTFVLLYQIQNLLNYVLIKLDTVNYIRTLLNIFI